MTDNKKDKIEQEIDKVVQETKKDLAYMTSALATQTLNDPLQPYQIETEDLTGLEFRQELEVSTSFSHGKVMVGSSSRSLPTFREEDLEELEQSRTRRVSSSTVSTLTRERIENKIEAVEAKMDKLLDLVKELIVKRECKCENCGDELKAQVVQPNK